MLINPEKRELRISFSAMEDLDTCKRLLYHRYFYKDKGLYPLKAKISLGIGKAIHSFLEAYYKKETTEFLIGELVKKFEDSQYGFMTTPEEKDVQLGIATIRGICNSYEEFTKESDEANIAEILGVEEYFEKELCTIIVDEEEWRVLLVGRVDLITRDTSGHIRDYDHKTMGRVTETFMDACAFSSQLKGYCLLTAEKYDEHVYRSTYNIIRKPLLRIKKNESIDEFCLRVEGDYKARPEHYYPTRRMTVYTYEELSEVKKWFISAAYEIIRLYKREVYRKTASSCEKYGKCDFLDVCVSGVINESLFKLKEQRW